MIKLWDAALTDALPGIVSAQPWVQALSMTWLDLQRRVLTCAQDSQVYTETDAASEAVLDALAVSLKIDWYDTAASVEEKRKAVQSAMAVRRTLGTMGALRTAMASIWPESTIEEWFEYSGEPGYFRVALDITGRRPEEVPEFREEEIIRSICVVKRASQKIDSAKMQIHRELQEARYAGAAMRWQGNTIITNGRDVHSTVHQPARWAAAVRPVPGTLVIASGGAAG